MHTKWRARGLSLLSHLCAFLIVSTMNCAVHAQVHKWTDKDGKVVYGDMPPPEAKSTSVNIPITSFGGSPVFKSYSTYAAKKVDPKAPPELVLYSADWCPHCRNAKAFFSVNSIAYREVNIDNDKSGAAEFKRVFGGGGIPLAAAGDKTLRGFSAESMLYFLKANGLVDKETYIEKGGKR
jgi:glutaredoxin